MGWFEDAVGVSFGGWQFIYHRWIEDHPEPPKPSRDLTLPTVEEGTSVPIVYGRCRIRQPVLVWSGNFLVPGDEYDRTDGGDTFTADHYSVDLLFLVGIPFYRGKGAFSGIWAGDTSITLVIDDESLSGPTVQTFRGGPGFFETSVEKLSVNGVFFRGSPTQNATGSFPANPNGGGAGPTTAFADGVFYGSAASAVAAFRFADEDMTLFPGMRHQELLFGHYCIGQSTSLPSLSVEVANGPADTASSFGNDATLDACPAAVLHDMLTSPWGKLALSADVIDRPSFAAASPILFAEGNGYARVIDRGEDAGAAVGDVLKQIDGLIYQEPITGKLVLKLIRNDFIVADLLVVDQSNIVALQSYQIQGWSETMNQVRVAFTDRLNLYADGIAIGQNMANVFAQGGKLRTLELRFPGCNNSDLAQKLAARELSAVSKPIAKATLVVNRSCYTVRPGDPIAWDWPELGIEKMVMRVARADLGQLHDGKITLDLVRDIFDVSNGAYPVPSSI